MTTLLQRAFDAAAQLPPDEQDLLASRVLAELAAENAFDQAIASSGAKLATLASAALAEYDAGQTRPLEPKWFGRQESRQQMTEEQCKQTSVAVFAATTPAWLSASACSR